MSHLCRCYRIVCLSVIIMVLVGFNSGCNRVGTTSAIEAMKMIPGNYDGYSYENTQQLRRDPDLGKAVWTGLHGDQLGISVNDVNWRAEGFRLDAGEYVILGGDFHLNKVRESLKSAGAKKTEYLDIEAWTGEYQGTNEKWLCALKPGCIFQGTETAGKEYLEVVTGITDSLYDNKDFRSVVEKVPGMFLLANRPGGMFPGIRFDAVQVDTIIVVAFGFERVDSRTLKHKYIGKFIDVATAAKSLSGFLAWVLTQTSPNLDDVQAVQEEQYVVVTLTFPATELSGN